MSTRPIRTSPRDDPSRREWRVEELKGTKCIFPKSILHRKAGPAIEYDDGTKEWYQEDMLHRMDGPAVECDDTRGGCDWYYRDVCLSGAKSAEMMDVLRQVVEDPRFTSRKYDEDDE